MSDCKNIPSDETLTFFPYLNLGVLPLTYGITSPLTFIPSSPSVGDIISAKISSSLVVLMESSSL